MSGIIDSAFASNSQSAADVAATLNTLASSVEKVTAAYQSLQNSVDDMADKVSGLGNTKLNALLGNISGKLGETIATQTELKNQLQSTASSLTDASGTAIQNKAELDKLVKESADSLANVKSDYEKNVKNSLDKLSKSMGDIDWTMDGAAIERLIRGLNPWPSAYTHVHGKTLKIWRAEVVAGDETKAPGTVLTGGKGELLVQTGKDALKITELQLEGKKRMDTEAFLRGYEVLPGTVLGQEEA